MSKSDPNFSFMELMKAEFDKFQNMKTEMEKLVRERDSLKEKVEEFKLKKEVYKTKFHQWKAIATTLSNSAGIPAPPSPLLLSRKRTRIDDDSISGTKEAANHSAIERISEQQANNVQAKIQIFGTTYLIPPIINEIKNNLRKEHLEKLQHSCFGHLLEIGTELKIQGQLLLQLLMHMDMAASNKECLVFNIHNKTVKFGAREFSLITGLRLSTSDAAAAAMTSSSSIQEKVFMGKSSILMKDIKNQFFNVSRIGEDGDEMPVKLALLYFLYGIFLAGNHQCKQVDQQYIPLIEDLNKFNAFPWGRVAFEFLASSMLSAKSRIDDPNAIYTVPSVNIYGFSVALQIWAYEVMPCLAAYCAVRAKIRERQIPRILHWSTQRKMIFSKHVQKLFTQGDEADLVLDGIQASPWELEALTTGTVPPKPKHRRSFIVKDEMSDAAMPTSLANAQTHLRACASTPANAHHVVKAEVQWQPVVGRCPSSAAAEVVILSDSDDDDDEASAAATAAASAIAASKLHSKDSDGEFPTDTHMMKFDELKRESRSI